MHYSFNHLVSRTLQFCQVTRAGRNQMGASFCFCCFAVFGSVLFIERRSILVLTLKKCTT